MIIKDLAEIPSEEILCLLNMEVRKKYVFGTCTCPFLFVGFFCRGGIINNLWIIRVLVKQREELANYSTPVTTLMTNDTLLKMKGVIHITTK